MVKLLVIADDFTGALDTGIQFAKKGIGTRVCIGQTIPKEELDASIQVLVVDTESRSLCPKEAYQVVHAVAKQGLELGITYLYKKTDSALRGNIGSELQAVLDASKENSLHFLPAYPQTGRITKNGRQLINGVPVNQTSFAVDPFNPVKSADIREILGEQTSIETLSVTAAESIPAETGKAQIVIYDAAAEDEMRLRAGELKACKKLHLVAGCAGFAAYLPEVLGLSGNFQGEILKTKAFYVACGSLNDITKAQVETAEKAGFVRHTLKGQERFDPSYYDTAQGRTFLQNLSESLLKNHRLETDTFSEENIGFESRDEAQFAEERLLVSACIGKIVCFLMEQEIDMTVLMTGGETLLGFMKLIGADSLTPVAEIEPGIVLSRFYTQGRSLQVISKSGGFGNADTFVRLAEKICKV